MNGILFGKLEPRDWINITSIIISLLIAIAGWFFVLCRDRKKEKREDKEKANNVVLEMKQLSFSLGSANFRSCFVDAEAIVYVNKPKDTMWGVFEKDREIAQEGQLVRFLTEEERKERNYSFDPVKQWKRVAQLVRYEIKNTGTGTAYNLRLYGMCIMMRSGEKGKQRIIERLDPHSTAIVDIFIVGGLNNVKIFLSPPKAAKDKSKSDSSSEISTPEESTDGKSFTFDTLSIDYDTLNRKDISFQKDVHV